MASGQIVKSVSLTPHTAMIVDDVLPSGKFSAFVRECLEQYENHMKPDSGQCLYPDSTSYDPNISKCSPIHKDRKCLHCWPKGSPRDQDWKEYIKKPIISQSGLIITYNKNYANDDFIENAAEENNPHKISFENYDQLLKDQAKKKNKNQK